jgi:hypothetical protein
LPGGILIAAVDKLRPQAGNEMRINLYCQDGEVPNCLLISALDDFQAPT